MSDPVVWLYAVENLPGISTDQKIRSILRTHLPADCVANQDALLMSRTSRGKPTLPGLPQWHISVTHSEKWFICAVSPLQVGIDLQVHSLLHGETGQQAAARYCKIARRFFHPAEADYVALAPQDHFFSVWTAKESFVKYTGKGVDSHFDAFCVLPPSPASCKLPVDTPWQATQATFRQTPFDENYTFCMCTPSPCQWCWVFPNADEIR